MKRTFYGLSSSPWTARAHFVVRHHRVPVRYVEHIPLLGEAKLRRAAKTKRASVPLLVSDGAPIMGSTAIARAIDEIGGGSKLFPNELEQEIGAWDERTETLLSHARAALLVALRESPRALEESLPAFIPGPIRPLMRFSARQGVDFLAKKYDVKSQAPKLEGEAVRILEEAARAVRGRDTLLDRFTFADVALATAMNAYQPTLREPLTAKLGDATREAWTRGEIVARFPELFAYRDRIYEKFGAL